MRLILAATALACVAGVALAQPTSSTTGTSTTSTTTSTKKNDEFNTYEMKSKTTSSSATTTTSSDSSSRSNVSVRRPDLRTGPANGPVNTDVNVSIGGSGGVDAPDSVMVLYEQPGFRGKRLTLVRDWPDFAPRRFDNLASSLRVEGVWELCDGANYTGRCVRVSGTTGDLASLGMADQVSSARRVR